MAKREMTLQSRLGFDDHELKTPQHDALMAWLTDNVTRCPRIIQWAEKKWNPDAIVTNIGTYKSEWEKPITKAGTGFIGFIDLSVTFKLSEIILTDNPNNHRGDSISYIGRRELMKWEHPETVNIEVKPSIRSVGETIRQINVYRNILPSYESAFVASPDVRFAPIFEAQGIGFIELPKLSGTPSQAQLLAPVEVDQ